MRNGYWLTVMTLVVVGVLAQYALAQEAASSPVDVEDTTVEGAPAAPGAEGTSGTPKTQPTTTGAGRPGGGPNWTFPVILIGGFLLMYLWMGRSKKKQARKRQEMLESLKKGDKVTSIGGVVGTVIEVRDDEVTVKVDENNNVRMKFARWAIRGVGDAAKAENPAQAERDEKK